MVPSTAPSASTQRGTGPFVAVLVEPMALSLGPRGSLGDDPSRAAQSSEKTPQTPSLGLWPAPMSTSPRSTRAHLGRDAAVDLDDAFVHGGPLTCTEFPLVVPLTVHCAIEQRARMRLDGRAACA